MEAATAFDRTDAAPRLPDVFARWFAGRGWAPRPHQLELLAKARAGRSVLLIAPTGGGKTLAGFLPTLVELYERSSFRPPSPQARSAPSPLVGEGWGGGYDANSEFAKLPPSRAPTPRPRHSTSPTRGEVKKESSLTTGG